MMLNKLSHTTLITFFLTILCSCSNEMTSEKEAVIKRDIRNQNIVFTLSSSDENLEYCVKNIKEEASTLDVFRVFLHIASELKERKYNQVKLCYENTTRFLLSGDDFNVLGKSLGTENPIYTLRTFPEKLFLPDGSNAYSKHEGGILYRVPLQLEDFKDMNEKWYLDDLKAKQKNDLNAKRPKKFSPDVDVF